MMRIRIATISVMTFAVLSFGCSQLFAGPCPIRADRLEDITACLTPMAGTIGMRARGGFAGPDRHHRVVLSAMHSRPVVPPQVVPLPAVYPYFAPAMFYAYAYHGSRPPGWAWWTMGYMNYLMWLSH